MATGPRPSLELSDIIHTHGGAYVESRGGVITTQERRTLKAIAACRTASLGGHIGQCDRCGHRVIAYNSCRNRHCPKCQAAGRAEWFHQRELELLPVEYFNVVFTVPKEIAAIALQNKKVVYDILFRTAAEALKTAAHDVKHLGAEIGVLSVLHTWGQNLEHHPHIHCVVTGGGLAPDGSRWVSCRRGFLFPVRVLGRLFRGKFLDQLKAAFADGRLRFSGSLAAVADHVSFRRYIQPTFAKDWVVYAKRPFHGPAPVLKYLARYTHRVAIANRRIVAAEGHTVSFTWKDYAHGSKRRIMTLSAVEFLRRFLLHILPTGFPRIRYYGFLANRHRQEKLARCRTLLGVSGDEKPEVADVGEFLAAGHEHAPLCPACKHGRLLCLLRFAPGTLSGPLVAGTCGEGYDTS